MELILLLFGTYNIDMIIRPLREEEKDMYNAAVHHPLQSWEWGEFRKQTGLKVERIGCFDNGKLIRAFQVTFHPIPLLSGYTLGYFPKGDMPDEEQLAALRQIGQKHNALFIKMEPNVGQKVGIPSAHANIARFLMDNGAQPGRPLFTRYSFLLDITPHEDKLFANLSSKTRYNVRLAIKKGVQIFENSTEEGLQQYIDILNETTKRQGFYAHTPDYFKTMWKQLKDSGMVKIFNAVYEGKVLVSWIMFTFNDILYYPYGASRSENREVMASNLLMWEMILFGKRQNCKSFDMWGSLGPEPDPKDPWFGFHKFKKGYGGDLMEFIGTYDLVLNPPLYKLFRIAEDMRWKLLRLRTRLPF